MNPRSLASSFPFGGRVVPRRSHGKRLLASQGGSQSDLKVEAWEAFSWLGMVHQVPNWMPESDIVLYLTLSAHAESVTYALL